MKTIFRYEHIDRSAALEEALEEKLQGVARVLASYDQDDAVVADVDCSRATGHHKGDVFTLRVNVSVAGHSFTADATGDDLYALGDEVVGKVHGAVQRFKERDRDVARGRDES